MFLTQFHDNRTRFPGLMQNIKGVLGHFWGHLSFDPKILRQEVPVWSEIVLIALILDEESEKNGLETIF